MSRMRPRSGAIHCDSAEQFLMMAEAAANQTGIFYDEKVNKAIMGKVQKTQISQKKRKQDIIGEEKEVKTDKDQFKNFNFNDKNEFERQQMEELIRKQNNLQKISVGILTLNINEVLNHISNLLQLRINVIYQSERSIDLLIINKADNIFKIWIINEQHIQSSSLFQFYVKQCDCLFKNKDSQNYFQTIQYKKEQHKLLVTQLLKVNQQFKLKPSP